jgi:hypothetical protein
LRKHLVSSGIGTRNCDAEAEMEWLIKEAS